MPHQSEVILPYEQKGKHMIFSLKKVTTPASAKVSKNRKNRTKCDAATADIRLDSGLISLARLRVVQILDCKRCMREYVALLKKSGETDQRLRLLESWRRVSAFTLREKSALNLAEAVTCNPFSSIPRRAIHPASILFTEEQMIFLALDIVAINDRHYLGSFRHGDMTRRPPHE
jgi:alkylhydroperoxidase family enzyme